MKIFVVTFNPPQVRWTLEEAKKLVEDDHWGVQLSWDVSASEPPQWYAYMQGGGGEEDAIRVKEMIWQIEKIPGEPPLRSMPFGQGAGAVLEMRVTTHKGSTSFQHTEPDDIWNMMVLGKGHIIQAFAERAARALSEQVIEGDSS